MKSVLLLTIFIFSQKELLAPTRSTNLSTLISSRWEELIKDKRICTKNWQYGSRNRIKEFIATNKEADWWPAFSKAYQTEVSDVTRRAIFYFNDALIYLSLALEKIETPIFTEAIKLCSSMALETKDAKIDSIPQHICAHLSDQQKTLLLDNTITIPSMEQAQQELLQAIDKEEYSQAIIAFREAEQLLLGAIETMNKLTEFFQCQPEERRSRRLTKDQIDKMSRSRDLPLRKTCSIEFPGPSTFRSIASATFINKTKH